MSCSLTDFLRYFSDHAIAYFFNFYHIAVPDSALQSGQLIFSDEYRKTYKFKALTTSKWWPGHAGECSNERDRCNHDDPICHYIQPKQMDELWKETWEAKKRKHVNKKNGDTPVDAANDAFRTG